jgi:DNA invertase Pin-like site-specific DNA recombinase
MVDHHPLPVFLTELDLGDPEFARKCLSWMRQTEFERTLICERTGEGRQRAMARGVKFGRPQALDEHQRREAAKRLAAGETQADVARSYRVDPATISRLAATL